jgi:transposase
MRKIRDVLRLTKESGMSLRKVALSLRISRDAVKDYLTRFEAAKLAWPLPSELDDGGLEQLLYPPFKATVSNRATQPDWAQVFEEMKAKNATLSGVHAEYLARHPDGIAYATFCEQYRAFKKTLKRSMRQDHRAGEKVFVDYAGPTMPVTDIKTGEVRKTQIFVGVLGASNYIYAEAVWSQQLPNWIASHTRMFEHIGGVPELVVCDNLKSAVTRASRTDPDIHPSYLDMAAHYGTAILPARAYKPKDKSKAENGVRIVERWILWCLRKEIFTSLVELNDAIKALLERANARKFQKLAGCRRDLLDKIDRPAMKPLPSSRYEFAEFRKARLGSDYHLDIGGHFYSAPHVLVGQEVDLRLTADTVEILHRGRRVGSHVRSPVPGRTSDPQHMPSTHRHLTEWNTEQELDWALDVGQHTHAFMQVLLSKATHREFGYRAATGLKSLGREFGLDRLEAACERAVCIGATAVRNVKSILINNIDRRPAAAERLQEAAFDHENIRGPESFH